MTGTEVGVKNSHRSKLESVIHSTSVVPPPKSVNLKFDSGASSHCL